MKISLLFTLVLLCFSSFGQTTKVEGVVVDSSSGEPLEFVTVRFQGTKTGTRTDSAGYYMIDSYYVSDSLVFTMPGYSKQAKAVKVDQAQVIDVSLKVPTSDFAEITIRAPDEFPSTTLHKKVIRNKPVNNKEKLESYEYEVYNKGQIDLNNVDEKFKKRGIVKKLNVVLDYLDSTDSGGAFLPLLLTETMSDFYYRTKPVKKREVITANRISGVENVQLSQFLGDMFLDFNVYDNNIYLFNKNFISPVSDYARNFYRFYLEDSAYIENNWCYKLTFKPKREGDMTFVGEMWIHDTTYAVKKFKADIAPWTNINYVQGLHIDQDFSQVQPGVWMVTKERLIGDIKLYRKTKVYGFYARRTTTKRKFKINQPYEPNFYSSNSTVEIDDSSEVRTEAYWDSVRHEPLSFKEQGIQEMIDTVKTLRFFRSLKKIIYLSTTGYLQLGKVELGDAFAIASYNQVEGFRTGLALRTSNKFSRRVELGGRFAYGFMDQRFKYGATIRANLTPKKRGLLNLYYNYDIEQIGQSPTAADVGSTFSTLLRSGPLDKLTFVEKAGVTFEKDVRKDVILYGGFEWKEYVPLGNALYLRPNQMTGIHDTINSIRTSELTLRYRWAKNEEFLAGAFDRRSIRSTFPIIAIQGIFGFKDFLGADYSYQKIDLLVEHTATVGFLGRIRYGLYGGYIFGTAGYPFLTVHPGNQSYWLQTNAFNKMNFFEFISDKYVSVLVENHWDGFFFDRIPWVRKAKLRLVTTGRAVWGSIDDRHSQEMLLPVDTKQFGNIPYVETALGIENILKVMRVDVFWRLTHLEPNVKTTHISNFGVRARYSFNF